MKPFIILAVFLILVSCQETESDSSLALSSQNSSVTITPVNTGSGSSQALAGYAMSSFSKYIYFHESEMKTMLDYNFFPDATDFNSQTKTATLPCSVPEDLDDNLNLSLNVPLQDTEPCTLILDLSAATFTVAGLEFSSQTVDIFLSDFGFKITASGFADEANAVFEVEFENSQLSDVSDLIAP